MTIPENLSTKGLNNIQKSITDVGVKDFFLIDQTISSTIGSNKNDTSLVVDIGKTMVKTIMFSLGKKVYSTSKTSNIECLIKNCLKEKKECTISDTLVEHIKVDVATVNPLDKVFTINTYGRDKSDIVQSIKVGSDDIQEVVFVYCNDVIQDIKNALKYAHINNIVIDSIVLTGGGSLLRGMNTYIFDTLSIPVYLHENPTCDSVRGAIEILKDEKLFKRHLTKEFDE